MLSSAILLTAAKAGSSYNHENRESDRTALINRLSWAQDSAPRSVATTEAEMENLQRMERAFNMPARVDTFLPTVEDALQWNATRSNIPSNKAFAQTHGLCLGFTVDHSNRSYQYCLALEIPEVNLIDGNGADLFLNKLDLPPTRIYHETDYVKSRFRIKGIVQQPHLQHDGTCRVQVKTRNSLNQTKWKDLFFKTETQAKQFITNVNTSIKELYDACAGRLWRTRLSEHVDWVTKFQLRIDSSSYESSGATVSDDNSPRIPVPRDGVAY